MNKLMNISNAVALIKDGDTIGIGGNVLHRAPMSLVREIIRQQKKKLKLVKTAGALDVDMLCLANCVQSVDAGFISYESEFGLANHYRKAVQDGIVKGNEHACYTVMSALRASIYGIPFMPVYGLKESDLVEKNDYFTKIKDPFSSEQVTVVKAIRPDVTIIHVQEADQHGNAIIYGPKYDDILAAKAAKKVIVSAENIVDESKFRFEDRKADIPHFMVCAVVHSPNGAAPCSCPKEYNIDRKSLSQFKALQDRIQLEDYLAQYEVVDYAGRRNV